MLITCPNCNFSKQIDTALLPPAATRANCPRCQTDFSLTPAETLVPAAPESAPQQPDSADRLPAPASPQAEIDALPKAGFWLRVVATLIDTALVVALQVVLSLALTMIGAASTGSGEQLATVIMLFGYLLGFAYYIVFTGHGGQTPGKMALRIKVIRRDGREVGYGRAALREVIGKFISGIILCIGYLMVAFDEQKQGLHDRMADTYVIKQ